MTSSREGEIAAFLATAGWGGAERSPLAGDASFRRYERVRRGDLSVVLMDAPPPRNDVRPFLAIDRVLRDLQLSAPDILAADPAAGLVLLEDLGDATYGRVLAQAGDEAGLYALAVDLLIELQRRFRRPGIGIPHFDDARAMREVELFLDWLWPAAVGGPVPEPLRQEFRALWQSVLPVRHGAPETLVLFDYHIDNLMWLPKRPGVAACGLLDFQDAVIGPSSFDLVSLLEDARRDVPADMAEDLIRRYLTAFPEYPQTGFRASYAVSGAQRSTRILGTFARLKLRDGKPAYLTHIPRIWRWLEQDLAHPALVSVKGWFDRYVPPSARSLPPALAA